MELLIAVLIGVVAFIILRKVLSVLFTLAFVALLAGAAYVFVIPMLL